MINARDAARYAARDARYDASAARYGAKYARNAEEAAQNKKLESMLRAAMGATNRFLPAKEIE